MITAKSASLLSTLKNCNQNWELNSTARHFCCNIDKLLLIRWGGHYFLTRYGKFSLRSKHFSRDFIQVKLKIKIFCCHFTIPEWRDMKSDMTPRSMIWKNSFLKNKMNFLKVDLIRVTVRVRVKTSYLSHRSSKS